VPWLNIVHPRVALLGKVGRAFGYIAVGCSAARRLEDVYPSRVSGRSLCPAAIGEERKISLAHPPRVCPASRPGTTTNTRHDSVTAAQRLPRVSDSRNLHSLLGKEGGNPLHVQFLRQAEGHLATFSGTHNHEPELLFTLPQ
jgi:hypothetical protein